MTIAGGHVKKASVKVERFLGIEESIQVRFFGQVANPLILMNARGRFVEDQSVSVGWEQQTQEQLDCRGFARPVGAEQSEDLASIDLQAESVEGNFLLSAPEVPVDLGQISSFDNG